ncbi:MAG: hypothetical protein L0Z50_29775 [Verrucomicrobiales bacterium]|nr:hypothetical protein [Verrucomicrobiales bacterium]
MKPELEVLLKAYDAFKQAQDGPEATRLLSIYDAKLEEASQTTKLNRETLHQAVSRFHSRWVRANLPPGFPKKLGME